MSSRCFRSLQTGAGVNPTVVCTLILSVDRLCPASGQRDSCVLLCGGLCSLEQLKAWQLHLMTFQTQLTPGIHIKQSSPCSPLKVYHQGAGLIYLFYWFKMCLTSASSSSFLFWSLRNCKIVSFAFIIESCSDSSYGPTQFCWINRKTKCRRGNKKGQVNERSFQSALQWCAQRTRQSGRNFLHSVHWNI